MKTCRELNKCIYERRPEGEECLNCKYCIVLKNGVWVDDVEKDPEDFNLVTQEYEKN